MLIAKLLFGSCLLVHMICCVNSVERIILSHHKTGTVLSRKISRLMTERYDIKTMGNGIGKAGLPDNSAVTHLMRNPFSMILSAYFYHTKTEENWVHCKMNDRLRYVYCPYVYDKFRGVQKTFRHMTNQWNGQVNITMMSNNEIVNKLIRFPKVRHDSYQSYLQRVSPNHGALLEFIRSNVHDIPSMVSDFYTIKRLAALSAPVPHFHNLCLGSLFGVDASGSIYNNMEAIYDLVGGLGISVTDWEKTRLLNGLRTSTAPNHHQTNHTSNIRGDLEVMLRRYDIDQFGGLMHEYEALLGCAFD